MLNIIEPIKEQAPLKTNRLVDNAFFDLLFRSYFILATLTSAISMLIWLAYLSGSYTMTKHGLSPLIWHTHEMLFGFAATIAVAFILTAVQTWTGLPTIRGKAVFALVVLWCAIRILLWINTELTVQLAICAQLAWWLTTPGVFTRLVVKGHNRRNYLFIPLLSVMAAINLGILIAELQGNTGLAQHLAKSVVLLFTLLMAVVGGRVIPFFTISGAKTAAINNHPLIERLLLPTAILGIATFLVGYFVTLPFTPAGLMIMGSALHFARLSRWRSIETLGMTLLWPLHLAYFFMSLGLLLLGLSYFGLGITFSSALHLITVGAIGLMILAMMSRVSLGHTGRLLQPKKMVSIALIAMSLAALVRAFLPLFDLPQFAWQLSTVLWCFACTIFIKIYWPILTAAKISR
jgi:uncharacterized protein involved in response to NO